MENLNKIEILSRLLKLEIYRVCLFFYAEKQEAPTRCAEASMQYGMLWELTKYNLIPDRSVLCLWLESRL